MQFPEIKVPFQLIVSWMDGGNTKDIKLETTANKIREM